MAVPIPNPENVQAILADFHDRIRLVVDEAWKEWLGIPWRGKLVYEPRARAMLVFDFIARRAREEFDGDPNIHVITKKQTVQFLFKREVLIRFKKGNARGIGSNIPTRAVLDFIDPQRTIPGLLPDIMKVEVCWSPDDLGIDLHEVSVVARNESARLWAYPLDRTVPSAGIIPMPPRTPDETPPAVVPRQPVPDEKSQDE